MKLAAALGEVLVPGRAPFPLLPPLREAPRPPRPAPSWRPLAAPAPLGRPRLRLAPSEPPRPPSRPVPRGVAPALRPPPVREAPRVQLRVAVTPAAVAAPPPLSTVGYAKEVGLLGSGQTLISMTPANLLITPRTDITQFTVITIDAGQY